MTETSYPFTYPPGNTMTENQWAQMFRYVLNTGVMSVGFQDQLNQLAVVPGTSVLTVDIDTGAAWIQGHYYQSDAVNTITIPQNTSYSTRADLIVLECKWGLNGGITAKIVEGTPGVVWPASSPRSGTPMPPVPIQTYGVKWQLPLCQVNTTQNKTTVYASSDIIDWRNFVSFGGAKSTTFVVASDNASASIRSNADLVIPYGSINAEQAIYDAILTVSGYGGGTVLLSEGVFNTSDSIDMMSNVTLRGLGTKTHIQYNVSGATNNNPVINCNALDNVTIADLTIDGGSGADLVDGSSPTESPTFDGINITNGTFVVVKNCRIKHCKARGIALINTYSDVSTSYGHRVEGCYISENASKGVYLQSNAAIVTNNQIIHNAYGIYLYSVSGNYGSNSNIITNNSVRLSLYDGIVMEAGSASGTGGCLNNIINHNIVTGSSQNLTNTSSNFKLTGAKCLYNMLEANFSQPAPGGAQPKYLIEVDANIDYNFIQGNYLYSPVSPPAVLGGSPKIPSNRIKYNFSVPGAAYGSYAYQYYD